LRDLENAQRVHLACGCGSRLKTQAPLDAFGRQRSENGVNRGEVDGPKRGMMPTLTTTCIGMMVRSLPGLRGAISSSDLLAEPEG